MREFLVDLSGTDYGLSANLRWVVLVAGLVNGLKALDGELVEVHPHVPFLHGAPFLFASWSYTFNTAIRDARAGAEVVQSTGRHRSTGCRRVEVVGAAQRCLCWMPGSAGRRPSAVVRRQNGTSPGRRGTGTPMLERWRYGCCRRPPRNLSNRRWCGENESETEGQAERKGQAHGEDERWGRRCAGRLSRRRRGGGGPRRGRVRRNQILWALSSVDLRSSKWIGR